MTQSKLLLTRRTTVLATLAGLSAAVLPEVSRAASATGLPRIRALAFDGFTIFDPRQVTRTVTAMVPQGGAALAAVWNNKLFALSWLETSAGRYSGFAVLADAALAQSAQSMGIELSPAQRTELVQTYRQLPAWPDAAAGLEQLRNAGIRLAFLSNLGADMLTDNLERNGLRALMDPPLSTDRVRAFKPAAKAYAMAPAHFGLAREEIGFVAFGGWDALGAKWFGYRTAWLNRLGVAQEPLDPAPDVVAPNFSGALQLAGLQ